MVSSDVVAAEKGLSKFRNELNQISWRIVANNRMKDTKLSQDDQWIKNPEYYESIMKVIGKAIGDCVTKQNEFANPTEDGLIVFAASPEGYRGEHWNAVLLYNLVYQVIIKSERLKSAEGHLPDIIKRIEMDLPTEKLLDDIIDKLKEHYQTDAVSGSVNYKFPTTMVADAKSDILAYCHALELRKALEYCNYECLRYMEYHDPNFLAPGIWTDVVWHKPYGNPLAEERAYQTNYLVSKIVIIEQDDKQHTIFRPYFFCDSNTGKCVIKQVDFFKQKFTVHPNGSITWDGSNEHAPADPEKVYTKSKEISENCGFLKELFGDLIEWYDE